MANAYVARRELIQWMGCRRRWRLPFPVLAQAHLGNPMKGAAPKHIKHTRIYMYFEKCISINYLIHLLFVYLLFVFVLFFTFT